MLNIETEELKISDKLKRKIDMIGKFANNSKCQTSEIDLYLKIKKD